MAPTSLLATKLHIPLPRTPRVKRTRLLERLDTALAPGVRLLLISAAAGFGKTELLSEWIAGHAQEDIHFAWLALDEGDNDPFDFWRHVFAAIRRAQPTLGNELEKALASPQPGDLQAAQTNLLNMLSAAEQRLVLVLDDYHLITQREIHAGIAFWLEHQPEGTRLAIATRADPPFPLIRLRARGQLVELRTDELRFTLPEFTQFTNQVMKLDLTSPDIQSLNARTEGWPAGVQLAALSLHQHSQPGEFIRAFSGSHQYILEYLTQEVLQRQPEALQDFLLRTCILEQLCAGLCAAVMAENAPVGQDRPELPAAHPSPAALAQPASPTERAQTLLEHLERANLFLVPLDDRRTWFRYHHLFADLLRIRLKERATPVEISILHRAAAGWHRQQGYLDAAVRHSLQAGDFGEAARLVEEAARDGMLSGRVATLLAWIEKIPPAELQARPHLQLYQAWAMFLNGQVVQAEARLRGLRDWLKPNRELPDYHQLRGMLASYLATCAAARGDPAAIILHVEEALAYIPAGSPTERARALVALGSAYGLLGEMAASNQSLAEASDLAQQAGNHFLHAHVLELLAGNQLHQGDLPGAASTSRQIISQAESGQMPELASLGLSLLAEIHLEWNDLSQAVEHLERSQHLARQGGIFYNRIGVLLTQARLVAAQDDLTPARQSLQQAEELYRAAPSLPMAVQVTAYPARLDIWPSDPETVPDWTNLARRVALINLPLEKMPVAVAEVQRVNLAWIHLRGEQPRHALEQVETVLQTAVPAGRMARVVEAHLIGALAHYAVGDLQAASRELEASIAIAVRSGYLRLFLEAGPRLAPLLRTWLIERSTRRSADPVTAHGRRIQTLLVEPPNRPAPQPASGLTGNELIEPLTQRELEILALIAAGRSNQEIADRLVISLHTAKKHTSNLLGKLGAANRTQAVARGRELGLLE